MFAALRAAVDASFVDANHFVFATNAAASIEFIRGYVERLVIRAGGYETEAERQP